MTADKTMLNFRCPNDLLEAIDQIGRQRYPADNKNGCDRSKTLMDIIQAGVQALSDGTVDVPISKTSKTDGKTEWEPQELKAALEAELIPQFNQLLSDNLETVRQEVRQELALFRSEVEEIKKPLAQR